MAFITFVTTYRPMVCGIADYTEYITGESPAGEWEVLSFDLKNGAPLRAKGPSQIDPVWYGIPSHDVYSAGDIMRGMSQRPDQVLWFQHEFGIWRDSIGFIEMLRGLAVPKVVTLHSLHFQSSETVYGLRRNEYHLLRALVPVTDAITVFGEGVAAAVGRAFPEYKEKVHILRHGAHVYPAVSSMSRMEAKARAHHYLVHESDLDEDSKAVLERERVLLSPDTVVIGGAGFVTRSKGIEKLFDACDLLRQALPDADIAAVYTGHLREPGNRPNSSYASGLTSTFRDARGLLLDTYLPRKMLAVMLRALDVYFYWPGDCTQSGIISHALGAGATIVSRNLEGVGETVGMAGGVIGSDFERTVARVQELVGNPAIRERLSERATRYADEFSWRRQAMRHFELADHLCRSGLHPVLDPTPAIPPGVDSAVATSLAR